MNGRLALTLILAVLPALRTTQVLAGETAPEARKVSFNRDVFPILSDRCFTCHGPDAKVRKAKLRLDRADGVDGAYRTHEGATAIKPRSLKESQLWYRITTDDVDEVMPPPSARKKPLSRAEQAIIKSWIEAGAPYPEAGVATNEPSWWSLKKPRRPPVPEVGEERTAPRG